MRRTLASHAGHIAGATAAVLAEIATRIRLALFAPVALVALAHRPQQLIDLALAVAIAESIADRVLAAIARVTRSADTMRGAANALSTGRHRLIETAHPIVLTLQIVAVLAAIARVARRTDALVDHGALLHAARRPIVAPIFAHAHRHLAPLARPLRLTVASQRCRRQRGQARLRGDTAHMAGALVLAVARAAIVLAVVAVVVGRTHATRTAIEYLAAAAIAGELAWTGRCVARMTFETGAGV